MRFKLFCATTLLAVVSSILPVYGVPVRTPPPVNDPVPKRPPPVRTPPPVSSIALMPEPVITDGVPPEPLNLAAYVRKRRILFNGETIVHQVGYASYCHEDKNLSEMLGGDRDVIHLNASVSKDNYLKGLQYKGLCKYMNQVYRIGSTWYSAYLDSFYCQMTPEQIASQQQHAPGYWRTVTSDMFRGRANAGVCTYEIARRYCNSAMANKSNGLLSCTPQPDDSAVLVWEHPITGERASQTVTKDEIQSAQSHAKSVEGIDEDITWLQAGRNFCASWSEKGGCISFMALAFGPDKATRLFGVLSVQGCYFVAGTCVTIIDKKIKDQEKEKQKLEKAKEERENCNKTQGSVPSPSPATQAASNSGSPVNSQDGVNLPDPIPAPVFDGNVTIGEWDPVSGGDDQGTSHK